MQDWLPRKQFTFARIVTVVQQGRIFFLKTKTLRIFVSYFQTRDEILLILKSTCTFSFAVYCIRVLVYRFCISSIKKLGRARRTGKVKNQILFDSKVRKSNLLFAVSIFSSNHVEHSSWAKRSKFVQLFGSLVVVVRFERVARIAGKRHACDFINAWRFERTVLNFD